MTDDYDDDFGLDVPGWLVTQIVLNVMVYGVTLLCMGSGVFKTILVVAVTTAFVYADYGRRFFINLGALALTLSLFSWIGADASIRDHFLRFLR
jgi:hypothetical protein